MPPLIVELHYDVPSNCSFKVRSEIVMAQDIFMIQVDCYAGYRDEETPRRFTMGSRIIEAAVILDRWLAPEN